MWRRYGSPAHADLFAHRRVAQVLQVAGVDRATFASLRGVYTGDDSVPGALQREFKTLTGMPIGVGWGMMEAIWLIIERDPPIDRDGCIGVPVGGAEIRADADTAELLVRGPMVMQQYWADPRAQRRDGARRLAAHRGPWPGRRLRRVVVHRPDQGHHRPADVQDHPGEVESALEQHPNVGIGRGRRAGP
jgi:long-chain acyl-CoA synthetase